MDQSLLDQFCKITGEKYALTEAADMAGYMTEWRDKYVGISPLVLLPGSVEEVAAIVRLASETGTVIVPQSGNTGLVGGQIPDQTGKEIVVSLKRLNQKRGISPKSRSMVVEAGVTLLEAQEFAADAGLLFPLSLASEGSCMIGGNISTNAGGIQVFKYGMMRDLVLGLEVVLPSGEIWHGLRDLRKDNTGYDLKQLFIGGEGTLGIVTAATLKLYPMPLERQTAFVGCESLEAFAAFFEHASSRAGAHLCAFEIMPALGLSFVLKHGSQSKAGQAQSPLESEFPWYGLIELEAEREGVVQPLMELLLEEAFEKELISDGVISNSEAQRKNLWALREEMSEVQKPEGGSIKHDISVPVADIPRFVEAANALVEHMIPGARPVPFGHFGDGNLHYNVSQPLGMDKEEFLSMWEILSDAVHDLVSEYGGSVSAEHGIGVMKRELLSRVKSKTELDLMRTVKHAIDPKGILNQGRVI